MQSYDMPILCMLYINVYHQRYLRGLAATLVFILFPSISIGLEDDMKISKKKCWSVQKVPEKTFQNF